MASRRLGTRGLGQLLFLALVTFLLSREAAGTGRAEGARYRLSVTLQESDLALVTPATVTAQLSAPELVEGSCLYFSLLDPLAARAQTLLAWGGSSVRDQAARQVAEVGGLSSPYLEPLQPFLYRVRSRPPEGQLNLSYELLLPGWKDRSSETRLLAQFYPQLLARCPRAGEEAMFFPERQATFQVTLNYPSSWSVLAQGAREAESWTYQGRQFSAVLYKRGTVKELSLKQGRLHILSSSSAFQDLDQPAAKAIELFSTLSGLSQENDLIVVETDDFESFNVPGLIALNRPQQKFMQLLQEEYLHWNVWQLGRALAEQWFGLAIKPASLDDYWLVQGFVDDFLLQFVESERLLGNLFVGSKGEEAYLQLRFRQAQDLQAAFLSLRYPNSALVSDSLLSRPLNGSSSPFNFVRHSQALRYLRWYLREPNYSHWLKHVVQRFQNEGLSPQALLESLKGELTAERPRAAQDLQNFWQSDTWPDIAVGEVRSHPEKGGATIEIQQLSPLKVAFDVTVKTKSGVRYTQEMRGDEPTLTLHIPHDAREIKDIEIDPQRVLFDRDRFNNTDRWPQFTLFPGGARTLRDDAYTVLWMPLASKLPGQSLSLQLAWQIERYIGSSIGGSIYYFPDKGTFGLRASYRKNLPDLALNSIFSVVENDGSLDPGERNWDLKLQRSPLSSSLKFWSADARFRFHQAVGRAEDNHTTAALGIMFQTNKHETCQHDLRLEHERSTWVPKGDFEFGRSFAMLRAGCDLPWLQFRLRNFLGAVQAEGPVPGSVQFQPQNINEARLRLDKPKLPAVSRVQVTNFDLSLPARLPLPDSGFVLPRRSVFKVYSDWGFLRQPDSRVHVAGVGYSLPFGGDVVGTSSITFLQFSLYSVLYRRIGDSVDTKAGFLFDFSGDL